MCFFHIKVNIECHPQFGDPISSGIARYKKLSRMGTRSSHQAVASPNSPVSNNLQMMLINRDHFKKLAS